MKKILSLIILTISLSACVTTPGLSEPSTYVYTITDRGLSGYNTMDPNQRKEISFIDAIGFTAVSPDGTAQFKTHHQVLHEELNKKILAEELNKNKR